MSEETALPATSRAPYLLERELFSSQRPRAPHYREIWAETEDVVAINNDFSLTFHLPSNGPGRVDTPEEHLVILVNGLGDMPNPGGHDMYNDRTDGLPALFAEHGWASVHLPLPYHFQRWPADHPRYAKVKNPSHVVYMSKERFYLGYDQMISDIQTLIKNVRTGSADIFRRYFNAETSIHLCGHSLGGQAVLAAMVSSRMDGADLCDRCCLLASGAPMVSLHPEEVFDDLEKESWETFMDYYRQRQFQKASYESDAERKTLELIDVDSNHFQIFDTCVVGIKTEETRAIFDTLQDVLREKASGTIYIGGDDRMIKPEDRPYQHKVIPGLGHLLYDDTSWRLWGRYLVADFIRTVLTP